jgi:hypothetical protein
LSQHQRVARTDLARGSGNQAIVLRALAFLKRGDGRRDAACLELQLDAAACREP